LKLLEENIEETLEDISISNNFLNRTPKISQGKRTRTDKLDCIKFKSSTHKRKQLPESKENLQNKGKSLPVILHIMINIQNI
jgi:hypothetical protein